MCSYKVVEAVDVQGVVSVQLLVESSGQASSTSQMPSLSESAKDPTQLQLLSMTSLMVQLSPSSQVAPTVQLSQPSGIPLPFASIVSSKPGHRSKTLQTPSLSVSAKVPVQLQSES